MFQINLVTTFIELFVLSNSIILSDLNLVYKVYNGWAFIALFNSFIYDVEIMYFGTIKEIFGWWILNFISCHFVHIEICFILIETLGESYTFLMYLTF